ncbi:hypothetical protein Tco_1014589 [Tanacetum coccineum]
MADLEFVDQHNMVACLEKTEGNTEFHEIVDFLTSSLVHFALTQIHATVDSKAVVVTEASKRNSFLFNDVDCTTCLTNEAILQNLALMGKGLKFSGTVTPLFPSMLVQNQAHKGEGSGTHTEHQPTPSVTQPSVLDLQQYKDAQAAEILQLKTRIKKLEKKCKPNISHHKAWLRSVSSTFDDLDANLAHGMDYMKTEEAMNEGRTSSKTEELNITNDTMIIEEKGIGEKGGSTEDLVSTDVPNDSTDPPIPTTVFEEEDIFLVDALVMLSDKTKLKGVEIKEMKDTDRPARSVLTLKPLPTIDPKDKGKGILEEEPEPVNVKSKGQDEAQIAMDEEARINVDSIVAARLQEEEGKSLLLKKELSGHKHAQLHRKNFEEIQVLYERQKKFVQDFVPIGSAEDKRRIEEMSKKATGKDTSKKQKVLKEPDGTKVEVKQDGAEESTRKTPCTILKIKARKKARKQTHADNDDDHNFEEDERKIESMNKKDAGESSEKGTDVSKKRKGGLRMKRQSKRKKTDSDLEEEEHLKTFLKIVPYEEGIGIYYNIFRSDGSSRWIKTFSEMVTRFDRLDLVELYNLVMQRFETTTPKGVDLVLWGDLRIMFNANAEDELWQNQER